MKIIKHISILFIVLTSSMTFAQVKFEAKVSKNAISLNETIQVDFEMNQQDDNFTPPNFNDFKVVSGPNKAIKNSWINGDKTYTKTVTYQIIPKKKGELVISKAKINIRGEVFETEILVITVK